MNNKRIPFAERQRAFKQLRAWGESINERARAMIREDNPGISDEDVAKALMLAWQGVRGSMDE